MSSLYRTQEEVARIMTERGYPMSRGRVQQIEQAAMRKLARNAALLELAAKAGILAEEDAKEQSP